MFRKEINGKVITVAIFVILAAVQLVYWRLLVYHQNESVPIQFRPAPPPPVIDNILGLEDVHVDTYAGGTPGFVDGPGWQARFCGPNALALDRDGSLLVADSRNHRIRRVTSDRIVRTIAGGGPTGDTGGSAVGPALQSRFRFPSGLALDEAGVIYIADTGNHRVCRLQNGQVTVLAQGAPLSAPAGLVLGSDGALWMLDADGPHIRRVDRSGTVTTPEAVPVEVAAALGDTRRDAVPERMSAWSHSDPELTLSKFVRGRRSPGGALDAKRRVFADLDNGTLLLQRGSEPPALLVGRFPSDGVASAASDGQGNRASFSIPCAVIAGKDGTVYVCDYEGNCIRRVTLPEWLVKEAPRVMPRRETRGGWNEDF